MWIDLLTTIAFFPVMCVIIWLIAKAERSERVPPIEPRMLGIVVRLLVVFAVACVVFLPIGINPSVPLVILAGLALFTFDLFGLLSFTGLPSLLLYHWIAWGTKSDPEGQGVAELDYGGHKKEKVSPLVGQIGVATTSLRPVGRVTIEEQHYEAKTELGMIAVGSTIRVIAQQGDMLIVAADSQ